MYSFSNTSRLTINSTMMQNENTYIGVSKSCNYLTTVRRESVFYPLWKLNLLGFVRFEKNKNIVVLDFYCLETFKFLEQFRLAVAPDYSEEFKIEPDFELYGFQNIWLRSSGSSIERFYLTVEGDLNNPEVSLKKVEGYDQIEENRLQSFFVKKYRFGVPTPTLLYTQVDQEKFFEYEYRVPTKNLKLGSKSYKTAFQQRIQAEEQSFSKLRITRNEFMLKMTSVDSFQIQRVCLNTKKITFRKEFTLSKEEYTPANSHQSTPSKDTYLNKSGSENQKSTRKRNSYSNFKNFNLMRLLGKIKTIMQLNKTTLLILFEGIGCILRIPVLSSVIHLDQHCWKDPEYDSWQIQYTSSIGCTLKTQQKGVDFSYGSRTAIKTKILQKKILSDHSTPLSEQDVTETTQVYHQRGSEIQFKFSAHFFEIFWDELPRGRLFLFSDLNNNFFFIPNFKMFSIEVEDGFFFFEPETIENFVMKTKQRLGTKALVYSPRAVSFIGLDSRNPKQFIRSLVSGKEEQVYEFGALNMTQGKLYFSPNMRSLFQIDKEQFYHYDPKLEKLISSFRYLSTKPAKRSFLGGLFSSSSSKSSKAPPEMNSNIFFTIKASASPDDKLCYIMRSSSNNGFKLILVDFQKKKFLKETTIFGDNIDDCEPLAFPDGLLMVGMRGRAKGSITMYNQDLERVGSVEISRKFMEDQIYLTDCKLIGLSVTKNLVYEIDLFSGDLKALYNLNLNLSKREVLGVRCSRLMNIIAVICANEIEFVDCGGSAPTFK